jgi:hypothetical protein
MHASLGFPFLVLGAVLAAAGAAPAQDLPSTDTLLAIASQLPKPPVSQGTTFASSDVAAAEAACGMKPFSMTLATGSSAARSVPVLLDRTPADAAAPVTLLAVLPRVAVDADGSPRTYHPDDPLGAGTCTAANGPDGKLHYSGVCALDKLSNGEFHVFSGSGPGVTHLSHADFVSAWTSIWPLIRDGKLKSFDLSTHAGNAPPGYYFFYWKDKNLTALVRRDNVAPTPNGGLPCRHDSGYFIAATSLHLIGDSPADMCNGSNFVDAEQIPFFVLPNDVFGNARLGDIVVARLNSASARPIYGIVGDTGPLTGFGEASVAFNQALRGVSEPVMNEAELEKFDIDDGTKTTIVLLGGTKTLLNNDYSRGNIEKTGSAAFARWNGAQSSPTGRLDACVKQLGAGQ